MTTNTLPSWLTEDEVLVATHGDVVPPAPLDRGVNTFDEEPAFEAYEKALVDSYDDESPRESECDCSWCTPVVKPESIDHPFVEKVASDDPFLASEAQPFIDALDAGPLGSFYPDTTYPEAPAPEDEITFTLSKDEMGKVNEVLWTAYNAISDLSDLLRRVDERATSAYYGEPTFSEEEQFIEALRESFDAIFAS